MRLRRPDGHPPLGRQSPDWLEQFLALPNGIPSRDCIRRLLMALKPEAFQKCFQDWIAQAIRSDDGGPDG